MRGKIVNLCIGFMNLFYGILIVFFTIYVPQDKTLLTIQENYVVKNLILAIYIVMASIVLIDIIQSYNHRSDTVFNTSYIIGAFAISFLLIKEPSIGLLNIISGLIILFKSIKENLVEINSTTAISIAIVVISVTCIIGIVSFKYADIGENIKNKENKDETAYKVDYFKYITELDITDPYINIKKDGKYGYVNQYGESVDIKYNFEYDYASPFIKINVYDKDFYIALVCKDGSSYIILKNGRTVMSYRTESNDDNYEAKMKELEKVYKETLSQPGDMQFEIPKVTDHMVRAEVYSEVQSEYTFRYDYSDEYDVIVTQSNLGHNDKYEFAKKDDINIRIALDTENLDYDSKYLYLYSNGTIPFFETDKRTQGWFTNYGMKNPMTGKAQLLDFFEEKVLLRDYNTSTIYFMNLENQEKVSEEYKDIYICDDGRYIVRKDDGFFKVINEEYNKVFEKEYASINPRLIESDLYLTTDTLDNIKFNDYGYVDTINWSFVNKNGDTILDGIEQVYDLYYKLPEDKDIDEENYLEFTENVKNLEYHFVGDKFYQNY